MISFNGRVICSADCSKEQILETIRGLNKSSLNPLYQIFSRIQLENQLTPYTDTFEIRLKNENPSQIGLSYRTRKGSVNNREFDLSKPDELKTTLGWIATQAANRQYKFTTDYMRDFVSRFISRTQTR